MIQYYSRGNAGPDEPSPELVRAAETIQAFLEAEGRLPTEEELYELPEVEEWLEDEIGKRITITDEAIILEDHLISGDVSWGYERAVIMLDEAIYDELESEKNCALEFLGRASKFKWRASMVDGPIYFVLNHLVSPDEEVIDRETAQKLVEAVFEHFREYYADEGGVPVISADPYAWDYPSLEVEIEGEALRIKVEYQGREGAAFRTYRERLVLTPAPAG